MLFCFFKQKTAYDMRISDWSSDVCSSDLLTVTIIVAVDGRHFGMVVDAVSDVLDVDPDQVRTVPDFGQAVDVDYLGGLVPSGERMVLLLEVEKLLRSEEWHQLDKAMPALEHAVAEPEAAQ